MLPHAVSPRAEHTLLLRLLRSYEVMSPHRIALTFKQAEVGQLKISQGLETLLAPALLPRGFPNMQLLQGIKDVSGSQLVACDCTLVRSTAPRRCQPVCM